MSVQRVGLGGEGATISRMLVGGWQLSRGHRDGSLDEGRLFQDLRRMVAAGLTTFDCADIYTGVEELFGRFAKQSDVPLQIHTKYVPDAQDLKALTRADVERTIDRSLARLQTERLDLVQFAWWDPAVPGYVEAALWLDELRRKGKIRHVGATNFNVACMREMLAAGVPLVCNQVQYSLFDRRPENGMVALAVEHDFVLLCYGTLAGGLLSEKYLGRSAADFEPGTRSLVKYRLILEEFGGWERYQQLLATLAAIARRHATSLSAVALRWALDRPAVGGVIVGTYHGGHLEANLGAFGVDLDAEDRRALDEVLRGSPGPPGDVFELERDAHGPHGRIMWRNLHQAGTP